MKENKHRIARINTNYFFVLILFCSLFTAPCFLLSALDFGLLLNQSAEYSNAGSDENYFEYSGALVPRLAFPVGKNGEIFASASFSVGYEEEDLFYYPELLRTEYNMRLGKLRFKLGRINYTDQTGYIASGLFDGLEAGYTTPAGRFFLTGLYSGLIYKKSSFITMTENDRALYNTELDYDDFFDTYFGSRRIIGAVAWEHPAVGDILSLKASVLGQFDFNDADSTINSQYFILKMGLPIARFLFEAGGSFSTMQREVDDVSFNQTAFSFDLGAFWIVPVNFYSRLSLAFNYTSGSINEDIGPFAPISTIYIGNVFETKRTAISAVSLDYSARVNQYIGLTLNTTYFVRNDLVTGTYLISEKDAGEEKHEFFLGPEIFARIVWGPVSDFQINLGGGVFIPALGNNWPDGKAQWKIEAAAVLAIF